MKCKNVIFFSSTFIFIIGIFIDTNLPYKLISNLTSKTITTTLSTKFACSTTGSESTLTTIANSKDATSGVGNWYCHKADGSWEICPDSFGCSSYSLTGWLGYDKVKSFDKAGNVSSEMDLYTIDSLKSSNYNHKLGVSFAINVGTNPVHIIDYKADVGTITNAQIKDGKIKLTGKPAKNTITKTVDNYFLASKDYLCKFGKLVEKDGNWMCSAENYRLQNETCSCVFNVNNGVYSLKAKGCERDATFCSDGYNINASDDDIFKVITKIDQDVSKNCTKEELDSDEHIDCFSSTYFDRELKSNCFTYYDNENFKGVFSSTKNNNWYTNYDKFADNIKNRNGNYKTGDIDETAKSVIVNASKSIENPCDPNALGSTNYSGKVNVNTKKNYISSGGWVSLCEFIEEKLNKGERVSGVTTDDGQLMVPFVGSAQCIFDSTKATNDSNLNKYKNYAQVKYDYNNNSVYYCNNGELVEKDGTYQCKVTEVDKITTHAYDWTVNYYRKK